MSFQENKAQLLSALANKQTDNTPQGYDWFVKGDVSGIQDFIFSVTSEKAAKSLKARSKFVEKQTDDAVADLTKLFQNKLEVVYNGGGNFYMLIKAKDIDFDALEKNINAELLKKKRDLYLALTPLSIEGNDLSAFGTVWSELQKKSVHNKLNKYRYIQEDIDFEDVFNVFPNLKDTVPPENKALEKDKLPTWNQAKRTKYNDLIAFLRKERKKVSERVSTEDGNIIDFDFLSAFAYTRTGTDKLGILKMDVDNLGDFFYRINEKNALVAASKSLSFFFDDWLQNLLKQPFKSDTFQDNIYVVFAGGDDCFMVGAWDAIFEFAKIVNTEFHNFKKEFKQFIVEKEKKLTLSASLLVVDEHYPVVQFAKLAEKALKEVKNKDTNKNKISVFGEILNWDEFDKTQSIASRLQHLILEKGESRAILDRIKRSKIGFNKMQDKLMNEGILRAQSVWRLKYFLRNVKKENDAEMKEIINEYEKLLLKTITQGTVINANLFPVAARWAELLTKKKNTNDEDDN
jgi:CRISPR/Cas system-associated protein Cas10 (large subunit of type III CRISPR-Cas system)